MQKQPNILFIFTDQQRLSALGSYGPTPCQTPNLDRLAKEGIRFETCYTTCPVCSPARASIISGQYPHRHGVLTNCGASGPVWNIPDHPRMLSRQLLEQGYRCGYTGKWHLCPEAQCLEWFNQPIPHHLPRDLGFDGQNFPGHGGGGFGYDEYKQYLADNGLSFSLKPGTANPKSNGWPTYGIQDGPKEATVDHFLTNHTMDLMDRYQASGEPFFIWHNYWGPHEPYYPVEEFFAPYRDLEIDPWPNFDVPGDLLQAQHHLKVHPRVREYDWSYWQQALRHYYAFTTQIDDQIGRLYAHLEETELLDETIIIFSSDHGETIGSHGGMVDKGYSHFEEIQRVGLLIRYPEKYRPADCPPGTVRQELASLADIYPTCLDLAGIEELPPETHGASLHALLTGRAESWRDAVFVEFGGLHTPTLMVTCRCGHWKYGYNANSTDELYNLADDPYETRNVIDAPANLAVRRDLLGRIAKQLPGGVCQEAERRLKEI
jgi:arylsulfatase A-like enzyme